MSESLAFLVLVNIQMLGGKKKKKKLLLLKLIKNISQRIPYLFSVEA